MWIDRPDHEGDEAVQPQPAEVRDGRAPPDDRQVALVHVVERLCLLAAQQPQDTPARVGPLLHRHRRDARQQPAMLLQMRGVAENHDLRMAGNREVRLHEYAPGAIRLGAEPPARGRGRHARRPEHRLRRDALSGDH